MAPRSTGVTRRIPVRDTDGDTVGWVMFDAFADTTQIEGNVYVPIEFFLRFPGDTTQPALLITFTVRDGAPMVTGVNIEAKSDGRKVQRSDIELVAGKLHEWADIAVKAVMLHAEEVEGSLIVGSRRVSRAEAARAASTGRKRANRKVNDTLLREVAKLYQDSAETGRYAAIRDRFTCSEPTAARWVGLAREAGHLPPITNTKGKKKK